MINHIHVYRWIDFRTLFNLSAKEISIRYISRLFSYVYISILILSFYEIKSNLYIGILLLIIAFFLIIINFTITNYFLHKEIFSKVDFKDDEVIRSVNKLYEKISKLPRPLKTFEAKNALFFTKKADLEYSKLGIIYNKIILKRYIIYFSYFSRKYASLSKSMKETHSYIESLPTDIKLKKDIRSEISRFYYSELVISFNLKSVNHKEIIYRLNYLIKEFSELGMTTELAAAIEFRKNLFSTMTG